MAFTKWFLKFLISVAFDVADFFIGRIPIFGTVFDILGGVLGTFLWKPLGALQFLELFDITDQIDALVPTLTIAALLNTKEIFEA